MNASEIMTKNPITVDERTSLLKAVELLQTLEIRHLPVVNRASGELIGMISDRDIRHTGTPFTILADERFDRVSVTEVMSTDTVIIGPEAELTEIIDLMLEQRIGALPVVDDDRNELLGIVSYVDLLRSLRDAT